MISGEATVDDNGTEVILYGEGVNICKDGEGHGTRNNSDKDLVLMALIMNILE